MLGRGKGDESDDFGWKIMTEPGRSKEDDRGGQLGRLGDRSYGTLVFSIGIRAIHQVGAAVFLAWHLLGLGDEIPLIYTVMVMASGAVLVWTEWLRHRQLYRELSGIVTVSKCLMLGAAVHGLLPEAPIVLLVFLVASLGAHAPKNVRHRLMF